MRRAIFHAPREYGLALFERAPSFELASTTPEGEPVLRTLHGVVVDGQLGFHGSPVGEKMSLVGRRAVAAVSEVVASLPSYFSDAERACPATTLYDSAQIHGTIAQVDDPVRKARVLSALMDKLQPEAGHVPIDPEHPRYGELYRKVVAKIAVWELPMERLDAKSKLLQHKSPGERARIIDNLWQRGAAGDAYAIERILDESDPGERPSFLRGPVDTSLRLVLGPGDAERAAALCAGTYWNDTFGVDEIIAAHRNATAWVGAHDANGELMATARALSDGSKHAWIYDVVVRPELRRKGLGNALMRLLVQHPGVRRARKVHLGTQDAIGFYAALGFVPQAEVRRPYVSTEMVMLR